MKERDAQRLQAFGEHLKKLRTAQGLSVRELAARCDVDYGKISKVENGKANLTLTTLFELAEGLALPIHELLIFSNNEVR